MKFWRCLWIAKEITSAELIVPPGPARAALARGMSPAVIEAVLSRCVDMPDGSGHGCFVLGESIDEALTAARARHTDWRPS